MQTESGLPELRVCIFGRIRMTYDQRPILFQKNNVTKVVKLAVILMLHGSQGIERNRLLEELYGREEMANAANNLRVTVYRLKKALAEAGLPEHEYIIVEDGVYRWSSPMETVVDAIRFQELIDRAQNMSDLQEKEELLKEALNLYRGDFLQEMSGEDWVLQETVRYKNLYTEALSQMCEYLKARGEYEAILRICEPACEMYPFDEWQSIKMDCYISLGRDNEALKEYEDTAKLFFEELGISPSDAMLNRLKEMSENMTGRYRLLNEIKNQLREHEKEAGAFYCSFPSFRDEYRLVSRIMERSGQSIYLLLFTITDSRGRPQKNEQRVKNMAETLHYAIKTALRRCDSFTRYSPGQFLVLLVGTSGEDCEVACNRIRHLFSRDCRSWAGCLSWQITSVADVENELPGAEFENR